MVPTQAGRFDTEEDVLRYMLDPFPWLLMAVYQLDQEHKIAGSVIDTSAKIADSAATTDGESTSREDTGKKFAPKKRAKGKGQKSGPKKQDQSAQKDKTIAMLKESLAKSQAENAKAQAENARLRGGAPPTDQAHLEPASRLAKAEVADKKESKSPAKPRPPQPAPSLAKVEEEAVLSFRLLDRDSLVPDIKRSGVRRNESEIHSVDQKSGSTLRLS